MKIKYIRIIFLISRTLFVPPLTLPVACRTCREPLLTRGRLRLAMDTIGFQKVIRLFWYRQSGKIHSLFVSKEYRQNDLSRCGVLVNQEHESHNLLDQSDLSVHKVQLYFN